MAAYVVIFREEPLQKPEELDEYRRKSAQNPRRDPNLVPLSVYKEVIPLEGDAPDAVILLQFPSVDDAKAWYYSPEYQSFVNHRIAAAKHRAVIVGG